MTKLIPDALLDLMAEKFQMLADPTRLAILRALMEGEKSVGQVVSETGRGQANISKHLRLLADSGLIHRRKEGLQVFYRLDDPLVEQLCALVCSNLRGELERKISKQREFLRKLPPA
jgi:ArsR family transcriptional regulator